MAPRCTEDTLWLAVWSLPEASPNLRSLQLAQRGQKAMECARLWDWSL